jgi:hypothetical protein
LWEELARASGPRKLLPNSYQIDQPNLYVE